jgi:hypothetical protein
MTHRHFCNVSGHYWDCDGKAFYPLAGDTQASVCMCRDHGVPMKEAEPYGDHVGHAASHIDYWAASTQKIGAARS